MPCPAASQEARWGWASERQKVLWGPWDGSGQAHRVDHVNGGWRHGDSDHWPKAFQPGFIQPRGLEHSPGAIPRGAHAHPGDYHGEDEEMGSQLCANSRRSLSLSLPISLPVKGLGSFQPREVYKRPSVFPGLLWAPCPKLPPRISGLVGPESHLGPESPRGC